MVYWKTIWQGAGKKDHTSKKSKCLLRQYSFCRTHRCRPYSGFSVFFSNFGFLPSLSDILVCHIAEEVRGRWNVVTARWYRRDGEGETVKAILWHGGHRHGGHGHSGHWDRVITIWWNSYEIISTGTSRELILACSPYLVRCKTLRLFHQSWRPRIRPLQKPRRWGILRKIGAKIHFLLSKV